jgi:preprotein translocase subunit SecG
MLTVFLILLAIAAILLILIILAQNPKGGGLSSSFGGSTQIIGARQTADFLEKASWYIAIGILVVILMTNVFKPSTEATTERKSIISDQVDEMAAPAPPQQQQQQQQQQTQPAPDKK